LQGSSRSYNSDRLIYHWSWIPLQARAWFAVSQASNSAVLNVETNDCSSPAKRLDECIEEIDQEDSVDDDSSFEIRLGLVTKMEELQVESFKAQ